MKHSCYYFVCSNRIENIGEITGRIYVDKNKYVNSNNEICSEDYYVSETEVPYNEVERYKEYDIQYFMMKNAA